MAMSSTEDFQEILTEFQKNVDVAENELAELRRKEQGMQNVKESLLHKRNQLQCDIENRRKKLNETRNRSKEAPSKKLFDDVFKLVDSCYHHQLLLLELEDQLTVAKTLHEEQEYINLIQGVTDSEDHPGKFDESSDLQSWYQQMKHHTTNSASNCDPVDEQYFYNMKLSSGSSTKTSGPTNTLSFTTRHKGYCLHLTIKETRSALSHIMASSTREYSITSDICLEGLMDQGAQHLRNGKSAADFITNVVWPLMDELCV